MTNTWQWPGPVQTGLREDKTENEEEEKQEEEVAPRGPYLSPGQKEVLPGRWQVATGG